MGEKGRGGRGRETETERGRGGREGERENVINFTQKFVTSLIIALLGPLKSLNNLIGCNHKHFHYLIIAMFALGVQANYKDITSISVELLDNGL